MLMILGGSIHTLKKNTKVLVAARKEIVVDVNAKKSKYTATYREQYAGQNHNIKTGNESLLSVEQFRLFGTAPINQNSIHKKIKSRLKS
jgi:hypothetical protein